MLSSEARRSPEGYRYVGGMLNIAYLTGFVRNPTENGFMLQQTNNLELAVPVSVSPGGRLPREFSPVTVLCHLYGQQRDSGERVLDLRAIDVKAPSTRSMPTWLAWNSSIPDHAKTDEFRPFGNNGELKGMIADQLGGGKEDEEDIVRAIIDATNGRLDTRLGDNANVVMLSGLIEAAAIEKANEHQNAYLGILIRQHKDPTKCIPVRLYSRQLAQHLKSISVGLPVKIVGQARTKIVTSEDGNTIVDKIIYVRCHELKVAERGIDIRIIPDWWQEMKERIMATRKQPPLEAPAAGGNAIEEVEGL